MSQRVHEIPREEITILERQRKSHDPQKIVDLSTSINEVGLIHPVVVRTDEDGNTVLVAGESRLKALEYLWNFGQKVRCGEYDYEEGIVPCLMFGDLTELEAYEIELEENIRRMDITWQEEASATAQLAELRRLQAEKEGKDAPLLQEIAAEVHPEMHIEAARAVLTDQLIIARHLDDPDVQKAKSLTEGVKVLKRKEETRKNAALAVSIGATFTARAHTLLHGDCLSLMQTLEKESFDVILTDPPYGIDAQDFGDSGGKAEGAHFYDDSLENWKNLMAYFSELSFSLAKPNAHLYAFCDIQNFQHLKLFMDMAGWKTFRTPLIWHNPGGMRAPWPEKGPQRRYQCILYAIKGDKNVTRLYGDVLEYRNDTNLGHPAQKPVDLLKDLLNRSVGPGDSVLDPFCGSGSIFPAAHHFKCKATGIEKDPSAYGLASKRLGELK